MAAGGGVRPRQAVQTKRGEVVGTCQDLCLGALLLWEKGGGDRQLCPHPRVAEPRAGLNPAHMCNILCQWQGCT